MATKTITTRIRNKVANIADWQNSTGILLDGEIAIVRVPTGGTYTNPITGKTEPVVELLMKVGDGVHKFNDTDDNGVPYLPWLSAKASDVYDWAKAQDPSTIEVKYSKDGTSTPVEATLADILRDLKTAESNIASISGSATATARGAISVTPTTATVAGVVQGVTYNSTTGEFTISYSLVEQMDIEDGAVTAGKIANGAVTNDKLGTGISSDKINVGNVTLTKKIEGMDADILTGKNHAETPHDYLPSNTNYAGSASKGGPANSVAHKLSIQLNGGTATEFDGSKAESINVTPAAIGAASQEAVFGSDNKGGLRGQVLANAANILQNAQDIDSLQKAIANGVDFIGVTTTDVSVTVNKTSNSVTIDSKTVAAVKGDIVIYNTREFIWDGSKWEELGDATRIGNLEQRVAELDAEDIAYGTGSNVKSALDDRYTKNEVYTKGDVYTKTEVDSELIKKSDGNHTHPGYENQNAFSNIKVGSTTVEADTATDTIQFAGSNITITPDATGDKITFSVAEGTTSVKGIVKLSDTSTGTVVADDSTTAATTKAVKEAYAQGVQGIAEASAVSADLHANYARLAETTAGSGIYTMHVGTGTDEIIFDCGGAPTA